MVFAYIHILNLIYLQFEYGVVNKPARTIVMSEVRPLQLRVIPKDIELKPCMVISWNVDGYTPDIHTWLLELVRKASPDVIFLSETKKPLATLEPLFKQFTNYNVIINVHQPANWHGVAMLIRKDHKYNQVAFPTSIPPRDDCNAVDGCTGRVIAILLDEQLYIIGSYTPNSGRGGKHLEYRTAIWDPGFATLLELLRANRPTMWVGDINVAPDVIDMSSPKAMGSWSGCLPEERGNFHALINTKNWIDIWRTQHPNERSYTWCGNPPRPNYGLRLDNIIVSSSLLPEMMNTFTISECPISADHIPIGAYVQLKLLKPI